MEPAGALALFFSVVQGMASRLIPDEITVITAGGEIAHSNLDVWASLAAIYAGTAVVFMLEFVIGLLIVGPVLRRLADRLGLPARWGQVEGRMHRCFGWVIGLGIFFPVLRHLVLMAAGACRLPMRRYMLAFLPGSIAWTCHYALAGYWYSDRLDVILHSVYQFSKITIVGISVSIVLYVFLRQLLRTGAAMSASSIAGMRDHGSE